MSRAYTTANVLLDNTTVALTSAATNVVSEEFGISAGDSKAIWCRITTDTISVTTGITVGLQFSYDGGSSWESADKTFTTVSADTTYEYSLMVERSGDQASFPLGTLGRVVVVAGASDTGNVNACWISRYK